MLCRLAPGSLAPSWSTIVLIKVDSDVSKLELNLAGLIAIKNCPVAGGPPSSPAKDDDCVPRFPHARQAVSISTKRPVPKPL